MTRGKNKLNFWIPYEELGLELIDADNLPVPDTVPLSGTFKFDEGTELKFTLGYCDKCILNVIVQSGTVKVYPANTIINVEIYVLI